MLLRPAFRALAHELVMDDLAKNPAPGAMAILQPRLRELTPTGWGNLSGNPNAIALLEQNLDRVQWNQLAHNPNPLAGSFLIGHLNRCAHPWDALSNAAAPEAMALLRQNPANIQWYALSANAAPEAVALLAENLANIEWKRFSGNPAPEAVAVWAQNLDRVVWPYVAEVPTAAAMAFLSQHLRTLDENELEETMECLCGNPTPEAMALLVQQWPLVMNNLEGSGSWWIAMCANPSAIPLVEPHLHLHRVHENDECWRELNMNPAAMDILEQNVAMVDLFELSANPNPRAMQLLQRLWCREHHRLAQCPHREEMLHDRFCGEDLVCWEHVCLHPNGISIVENHMDQVEWCAVSANPAIFDDLDHILLK